MTAASRPSPRASVAIVAVLAVAMLAPPAVTAQPPARVARIGYLMTGPLESPET